MNNSVFETWTLQIWKKNATHLITIFGLLTANAKNVPESTCHCVVKLRHEPLNYALI